MQMIKFLKAYYKIAWRCFWFSWCIPGHVLLWVTYYYPTEWGKKRNVTLTGRQMRKRHIFAPINSLFICAAMLFIFPHPYFIYFGLVLILFGLPLVPLLLIIYIVMQPEMMNSFMNWASYLLPF